jgi:hypothetical protein
MTIDERLEALTQTVELIAAMHRDNEARMAEMRDAITRLANIAEIHQEHLDNHDERLDRLEGK